MSRATTTLCACAALIGAVTAAVAFSEGRAAPMEKADVAKKLVAVFDKLFGGPHPNARAAHAKGLLVDGYFEPSPSAASISRAAHLQSGRTPLVVRFSNFAGVPAIPDGDPNSSPRGMAIKFLPTDGFDTDIVAHSYNGFAAATPEDLLAFLTVATDNKPDALKAYLDTHPAAKRFVETPKPAPESFVRENYFGVNAMKFTTAAGKMVYGRYRIEPVSGAAHLDDKTAAAKPADYLGQELSQRLQTGPAQMRLLVQLAQPGDQVNDGSTAWPDDRPTVELGIIHLATVRNGDPAAQNALLFTPLNVVPGIAPSDDPLLAARTRTYSISYDRRTSSSSLPIRK